MARKRKITTKERTRIRLAIKDRLQFFAPTISPAPKDMSTGEIESIRNAINLFKEAGSKLAILQPKYMGSYCDIYLTKDINDTGFFSRRGYPMRNLDRNELIEAVRPIWNRFDWSNAELRIIQSELMPWAALGDRLIERDFGSYGQCHKDHFKYINEANLYAEIKTQKTDSKYIEYLDDMSKMKKAEIKKKYPGHIISHYRALEAIEVPEPNNYMDSIALYDEQLKIYGAAGELFLKPFCLLKTVYSDGTEEVVKSHLNGFMAVSDDDICVVDLSQDDLEEQILMAYKYFDTLSEKNMEGVVIKPVEPWGLDTVPMFKVRNNDYLQMIYGVNFQKDYPYYLRRRNTRRKMQCSSNQWKIAEATLRMPTKEVSRDNERYVSLVKARIIEEDYEALLDSRL